jgi:hypothetical protein
LLVRAIVIAVKLNPYKNPMVSELVLVLQMRKQKFREMK